MNATVVLLSVGLGRLVGWVWGHKIRKVLNDAHKRILAVSKALKKPTA